MRDESQKAWERFLNPDTLRSNLMVASIYIATYELLDQTVLGWVHDCFFLGLDDSDPAVVGKYKAQVLSRNRSPVYASLGWLESQQVITGEDVTCFENAKKCRNAIAHEMTRMLMDGLPPDLPEHFREMVDILGKIEKWWIISFEIPVNEEFDGKEIDENEVVPGRIIGLQMMLDVALGPEDDARRFFENFIKSSRNA
jgi:hypothetical protein